MLRTLPETIALLELRLSVEVEAAGLCAERRTDQEAAAIRRLMEQTDACHDDPAAIEIHYDYDFHLAVARAARNALMHGFLAYLRPLIVPRFRLAHIVSADLKDAYYAMIHGEHEAIAAAIDRRDGAAARAAMRTHLVNSLARVRALGTAAGRDRAEALPARDVDALLATLLRPLPVGRHVSSGGGSGTGTARRRRLVKAAL